MSLAQKKAALAEARQKLDAARKAADANKEDAALATAVQEAVAAVTKANDEYIDALERADPLSQNIEDRISKARKEEKEKLYASLEKQKQEKEEADKRAKELEDRLKKLEEEKKKLDDANSDGDKKKKNADEIADVEKRILERVAKAEQEAAATKLEAEQKVAALQKELEHKDLEAYKAKKLAEAGNTVVVELVSGATKEEIDNSIVRAQQAKARIVKEIEAARAGAGDEIKNRVPTPPGPQANLTQLTGTLTADQIRKMSPTEWAQHRKSLGFK